MRHEIALVLLMFEQTKNPQATLDWIAENRPSIVARRDTELLAYTDTVAGLCQLALETPPPVEETIALFDSAIDLSEQLPLLGRAVRWYRAVCIAIQASEANSADARRAAIERLRDDISWIDMNALTTGYNIYAGLFYSLVGELYFTLDDNEQVIWWAGRAMGMMTGAESDARVRLALRHGLLIMIGNVEPRRASNPNYLRSLVYRPGELGTIALS